MNYSVAIFGIMMLFVIPDVFAQDIPSWVKNSAGWWADGSIDDIDFVKGIEYLVNENIISVDVDMEHNKKSENIPSWVKNSAGWWADDQIDDTTFVRGIQYLVSNGIISVKSEHGMSGERLILGGFDLSNAGPFEGKSDALFTIIMFGDHQCEKCVQWMSHEKKILADNLIDSGIAKFFILDYPMLGDDSVSAAEATYCAQDQGKYFDYLGMLNKKYTGIQNGWASIDALVGYSKELNLDFKEFDNCLFWNTHALRVDFNKKVALSHGVTGTPTFFIIGPDDQSKKIIGSQPPMIFEAVIKEME